jgi:hypothetical protein
MGFRPENMSSQAQTYAPEAEGLADIDDGAGATRKELTVLTADAHPAFANVLFSLKEKLGDRSPDAREIVVTMADVLDIGRGHVSMAVQQDDQAAGVLLRPMYPAAEAPGSKDGTDFIILCIYRVTEKTEPNLQRTLQQFVGNVPPTHAPKFCQYPTAEVKRLVRVLDANAKKFESNMRSSAVWREWFMQWAKKIAADAQLPDTSYGFVQSYVTTSDFAKIAADSRSQGACGHCGQANAKNRCKRCGIVFYCSLECQKSSWKEHKLVCKSTKDKLEQGHIVTADVTIAPPGMEGMFLKTMNLNAPLSQLGNRAASSKTAGQTPMSRADGEMIIVKVQVAMNPHTPMMVYDHKKNIEFLLHPGNSSADDCERIFNLIRTKGEAGGRKGYFNCEVQAGGTKVLLHVDKLLPLQNW